MRTAAAENRHKDNSQSPKKPPQDPAGKVIKTPLMLAYSLFYEYYHFF